MISDFNLLLLIRIIVVLGMAAFLFRFLIKNVWKEFSVGNYDPMLILQSLLFILIPVVTPFTILPLPLWVQFLGLAGMILGAIMLVNGFFELGSSFSGGVTPIEAGKLVTSGYYAVVRHPMYGGVILILFGWSIFWGTWLGLLLSFLAIFLFHVKASKEEKLLAEKYPEYEAYKARVTKKLIPYIL
ncbi:MAG: isoprenylcysteine carboxylmethyltransferase family protein [Parachlamydia sp.]|nr:isoprenylcysteine carboxylmethyltransferase family protein [Parachlamydia sp.]